MSDTTVKKPTTFSQAIVEYFAGFAVLRETRAEYWGIQLVNLLDCTIYFALLTIAAVFLSEDLGFSDTHAGYIVTLFTSATTLFLMISGMITDWLGIKRSLLLALVGLILLRVVVAVVGLTPDVPMRGTIVAGALFLMAPFMAMIQTVFQAANKRFTTKRSRSAGFTLWYLFMNIGATLAGFSVDIVRLNLKLSNAHIFTMGAGLGILALLVALILVRNETQLLGPDEEPEPVAPKAAKRQNPIVILVAVMKESAFWKLTALVGLLLGVRAVFAYFYLLMPKYWLRTIGGDAAIGTLNAINPLIIVFGLVLFIPFANRFNLFKMLTYGAVVSALSLFILAMPWQLFGSDIADAHYWMAAISIVVLSIGEIVWSPKLSEYTAAVAPKGQEGTYLGFTMIPWFVAKMIVSALSGHMLARWCPEDIGKQMTQGTVAYFDSPAAMWLLLGVVAMAGVLLAIALKPWFVKGARWTVEQ